MVVGPPKPAARALKVRQHRIPWVIGQVQVKVSDAKPPGKNGKEKKEARK